MRMPQGYGMPYQPPPLAAGRLSGGRGRLRHQLIIGGALLTLGLLAGLTRTSRGLLAIGLAWVVVGLLAGHRADGRREWFKAVIEYAVVAALAVALLTAAPAPPQAKAPGRERPPAAERAQADPWAELRTKASKWWAKVAAGAPEVKFSDRQGGR
jgi:hypothetical protein